MIEIDGLVAGVDEAGRGPLAGPVVVAAVILDPRRRINGLRDSKILTAARRETLDARIRARALAFSVVAIEVDDIDRFNIFQATMLGMARAIAALALRPARALIDGNHVPQNIQCEGRAIVDGDALEPAISAASETLRLATSFPKTTCSPIAISRRCRRGFPTAMGSRARTASPSRTPSRRISSISRSSRLVRSRISSERF